MVILAVSRPKRKKVLLHIDGDHVFAVEEEAWVSCGFFVGQDVSQQQLDDLLSHSHHVEARRRALSLLSARSYTSGRLTNNLAQTSGIEAAQQAVERMAELGLIDDRAYASRLAMQLYETKYYAPRRIRFELQRREIANAFIDEALSQFDPAEDVPRAVCLLRRRFCSLATKADCRRAGALLERYGYCGGTIHAALREFLCDETEG